MRTILAETIIEAVKEGCLKANFELDAKTHQTLKDMKSVEKSESGLFVLDEILDNAEIAADEKMPLCQDTGVSIFFVKMGVDCHLQGGTIHEILDEAVRQAYSEGYLRKSILKDPIYDRSNTGDNTPAVIHLEQVPGEVLEIEFLAKGAGADNCSQVAMLKPSDGLNGIKDFVLKVCEEAGASSCPPWILGIGIGGTFDSVAGLAKHAILRDIGSEHKDPQYRNLEHEIKDAVNATGIGPQGLGGKVTALAVHIESRPCHAASLPIAVNIQCHSNRKAMIQL